MYSTCICKVIWSRIFCNQINHVISFAMHLYRIWREFGVLYWSGHGHWLSGRYCTCSVFCRDLIIHIRGVLSHLWLCEYSHEHKQQSAALMNFQLNIEVQSVCCVFFFFCCCCFVYKILVLFQNSPVFNLPSDIKATLNPVARCLVLL